MTLLIIIFIDSIINIELKEIKIQKSFLALKKQFNSKNIKNFTKNNLYILTNNINHNQTSANNKTKNAEELFRKYEHISFIFLFCGSFIMLYGAFYYKLSLIIHFSLFLYYFFILILPDINPLLYPFILFFSCISGVLIYKYVSTDDIASIKFKIQKMIYGGILGCFLHKIIFYYINIFVINQDIGKKYYIPFYITYFVFILIFGVFPFFIPDNLIFLFCSTISSSFYIINNIDCIIYIEYEKKEKFITSIIIHIIIIILSFFFQIHHIKSKYSEDPNVSNFENNNSRRNSSYSSKSSQSLEIKFGSISKEPILLENKVINEDDDEEEEQDD